MNGRGPVSINDIVAASGLSRATVDRVLNKRAGVHPRTQAHVLRTIAHLENNGRTPMSAPSAFDLRGTHRFGIIVQAGDTFTRSIIERVKTLKQTDSGNDATLQAFASRSDEETIDLIRSIGSDSD